MYIVKDMMSLMSKICSLKWESIQTMCHACYWLSHVKLVWVCLCMLVLYMYCWTIRWWRQRVCSPEAWQI